MSIAPVTTPPPAGSAELPQVPASGDVDDSQAPAAFGELFVRAMLNLGRPALPADSTQQTERASAARVPNLGRPAQQATPTGETEGASSAGVPDVDGPAGRPREASGEYRTAALAGAGPDIAPGRADGPLAAPGRRSPLQQSVLARRAGGARSALSGLALPGASPLVVPGSLLSDAVAQLGKPYVFGAQDQGSNPAAFDCSSFTKWLFGRQGVPMPRTAQQQYQASRALSAPEARPGDLVFFRDTYDTSDVITHVGVLLDGGRMVSAVGTGVRVDSLNDAFWASHLVGFRRPVGGPPIQARGIGGIAGAGLPSADLASLLLGRAPLVTGTAHVGIPAEPAEADGPGAPTAVHRPQLSALIASADTWAAALAAPPRPGTLDEALRLDNVPREARPSALAGALAERVVRSARLLRQGEETTLHLRLDPPALGSVEVRVTAVDGGVRISLVAERRETQQAIQAGLPDLANAIRDHGIAVQRTDVWLTGWGLDSGGGQRHHAGAEQLAFRWQPASPRAQDEGADRGEPDGGPGIIDVRI